MRLFKIFTESKADIKFLKDYISETFQTDLEESDLDPIGSWSAYKAKGVLKASIEETHLRDQKILIILDADTDFATRQTEVLTDFERFGIPIHLFLFPNNAANGALENLLCDIAVENKIMQCFDSYVICVEGYESPVTKSKVFAYLDALLPAKHKKNDSNDLIQDKNRNYRNPAHWDLHHEALAPLKSFLSPFFE